MPKQAETIEIVINERCELGLAHSYERVSRIDTDYKIEAKSLKSDSILHKVKCIEEEDQSQVFRNRVKN